MEKRTCPVCGVQYPMNEAACPNCYWPADKPYPPTSDDSAGAPSDGSAPASPGGGSPSGGSAPASPGGGAPSGGSAPASPGGGAPSGGSAPASPGGGAPAGGSAPASPGGGASSGSSAPASPGGGAPLGGSAPASPGSGAPSGGSAPASSGAGADASVVPPEIPEIPEVPIVNAGQTTGGATESGGGSVEPEIPSFDLPETGDAPAQPAVPSAKGRRLWLWIVLAVLLGALLAAGGWYVWTQWSDYDRRTEDARRELSRDEVDQYDSSLDLSTLNNQSSGSLFGGDVSDNDSTAEVVDAMDVDTVAYEEPVADSLAAW